MLPGMELMGCGELAVPAQVMHHVVQVESSGNPYAIGVVGTRLARQPRSTEEAVATARMLEAGGHNFSLGLAQVNRYNLAKYGLHSYEAAFEVCPNLRAGARILAECHGRSGNDWGKALSCYYSGNFTTGFRHGYVQRVFASMGLPATSMGTWTGDGSLEHRRVSVGRGSTYTSRAGAARGRRLGDGVANVAPVPAAVAAPHVVQVPVAPLAVRGVSQPQLEAKPLEDMAFVF